MVSNSSVLPDLVTFRYQNGYGGQLDGQHWILPSEFESQNLVSINIKCNGSHGVQRIMLSAITLCSKKEERKN